MGNSFTTTSKQAPATGDGPLQSPDVSNLIANNGHDRGADAATPRSRSCERREGAKIANDRTIADFPHKLSLQC